MHHVCLDELCLMLSGESYVCHTDEMASLETLKHV